MPELLLLSGYGDGQVLLADSEWRRDQDEERRGRFGFVLPRRL